MARKRAKVQAMERGKMKQIKPGLFVKLEGNTIIITAANGAKVALITSDAIKWALDRTKKASDCQGTRA